LELLAVEAVLPPLLSEASLVPFCFGVFAAFLSPASLTGENTCSVLAGFLGVAALAGLPVCS